MTRLQAIRKFGNFLAGEKIIIARDRCSEGNWAMDITNTIPRLKVPKDLDYTDEEDRMFRADFIVRCPIAKDFSDITLTILHEFGHWYTRNVMDVIVYNEIIQREDDYFTNPYEILATQWAICWLLCPANQQVAKSFENEYFG